MKIVFHPLTRWVRLFVLLSEYCKCNHSPTRVYWTVHSSGCVFHICNSEQTVKLQLNQSEFQLFEMDSMNQPLYFDNFPLIALSLLSHQIHTSLISHKRNIEVPDRMMWEFKEPDHFPTEIKFYGPDFFVKVYKGDTELQHLPSFQSLIPDLDISIPSRDPRYPVATVSMEKPDFPEFFSPSDHPAAATHIQLQASLFQQKFAGFVFQPPGVICTCESDHLKFSTVNQTHRNADLLMLRSDELLPFHPGMVMISKPSRESGGPPRATSLRFKLDMSKLLDIYTILHNELFVSHSAYPVHLYITETNLTVQIPICRMVDGQTNYIQLQWYNDIFVN